MNAFKAAALAAITLAAAGLGLAQSAAAQPGALPGAMPPPPSGALANDGPYAGTSRKDFYQPSDRIKHIQNEIEQAGMPSAQARQAMAQLTAISHDLQYRMARHNGNLLDWDRELINQKLDALVQQYPALRT